MNEHQGCNYAALWHMDFVITWNIVLLTMICVCVCLSDLVNNLDVNGESISKLCRTARIEINLFLAIASKVKIFVCFCFWQLIMSTEKCVLLHYIAYMMPKGMKARPK